MAGGAGGLVAAAACLAAAAATSDARERPSCKSAERDGFPIIAKAEVAKHKSAQAGGVWVTYAGGVYDITEFIASHPGGASRISMAAGGALEPFWKLYALHKKDEVVMRSSEMRWCHHKDRCFRVRRRTDYIRIRRTECNTTGCYSEVFQKALLIANLLELSHTCSTQRSSQTLCFEPLGPEHSPHECLTVFCWAAQVLDILKTLRIGSLSLEDMAEEKSNADKDNDDPYAKVSRRAYVCALVERGQLPHTLHASVYPLEQPFSLQRTVVDALLDCRGSNPLNLHTVFSLFRILAR